MNEPTPVPFDYIVSSSAAGATIMRSARVGECRYLGAGLVGDDGRPILRECQSCNGKTSLKVFACEHPAHAIDPTTTYWACESCADYEPRARD